jgi:hypothetical protein
MSKLARSAGGGLNVRNRASSFEKIFAALGAKSPPVTARRSAHFLGAADRARRTHRRPIALKREMSHNV